MEKCRIDGTMNNLHLHICTFIKLHTIVIRYKITIFNNNNVRNLRRILHNKFLYFKLYM